MPKQISLLFISIVVLSFTSCNKTATNVVQDCSNGTITEKLLCNDGKWSIIRISDITEIGFNGQKRYYTDTTYETWIFTKDNFVQIAPNNSVVWSFKNTSKANTLSIDGVDYAIDLSKGMHLGMYGAYNTPSQMPLLHYETRIEMKK